MFSSSGVISITSSETHTLSDEVIEITPELENLLSGYTKKVKKQNAKINSC